MGPRGALELLSGMSAKLLSDAYTLGASCRELFGAASMELFDAAYMPVLIGASHMFTSLLAEKWLLLMVANSS